jgi:hypothetical protein
MLMSDLLDLPVWIDAVRASPIFPIALPVLLAAALATIADRIECYLLEQHPRVAGDRCEKQPLNSASSSALETSNGSMRAR